MKIETKWFTLPVLGLLAAVLVFNSPTAIAAIIHVPADYPTIGAAVTAASPGDTIVVAADTYNEQVQITKTLTLRGAQAGKRTSETRRPGTRPSGNEPEQVPT